MDDELKQHITAKDTWLRGLFILVFAFLLAVARVVTWAVVVLQFLFTLFTGRPNQNLLSLGASLAQYIYQCFRFVTFNSEVRPFPFSDWPEPGLLTPAGEGGTAGGSTGADEPPAPAKKKPAPKKASRKKKSSVKKAAAGKSPEASAPAEPKAEDSGSVATDDEGGTPPPFNPA